MLPALRWLCAALSFMIFVGSGVAWAMYRDFSGDVRKGSSVPGGSDADGASKNILLVGDDTRQGATRAERQALHTGNDQTTVNADTMMLLHVPGESRKPTLISFPRDSWVDIPGYGPNKLNAAYPIGYNEALQAGRTREQAQSAGLVLTIKAIHALTGLRVDHYMQVNLLGFYRISEAIGGVTVCLNHAQNATTDKDEHGSGYSGIDLPAGVSVIHGAQALAFVRQRHGLPRGDLDRIRRQQYFLAAAFDKIASAGILLNPFKLHDLLDAIGSSLLVDPDLDLAALAQQFVSLTSGKIVFETIPNTGPRLIHPGGVETSIVQVDRAALPGFIKRLDGTAPSMKDVTAAKPASVTVDVYNGADVDHLAADNAAQLTRFGFKIGVVGSVDPTPKTTIFYPAGAEAQAKAVQARVPKATLVETTAVRRVALHLGANKVQVQGLSAPATSSGSSTGKAADPTRGLGCID